MPLMWEWVFYLWSILCSRVPFALGQLLSQLCQSNGHSCDSRASSTFRTNCKHSGAELLFNASSFLYWNVSDMVVVFTVKMSAPSDPLIHFNLLFVFDCLHCSFCLLFGDIHHQLREFINSHNALVSRTYSQLHSKFGVHHFVKSNAL
jgi:hypothetical protein